MAASKIAVSMDERLVKKMDRLVSKKIYPSRSRIIQEAVEEKLNRLEKNRLAEECAKLKPEFEQALAEESFTGDMETWPEY